MARTVLGAPLAVKGVPEGLAALPVGTDGADGPRLQRDRHGRTRVSTVVLAAADALEPAKPPALSERDWSFVLARPARRWATIAQRFGDAAHDVAAGLARAGVVRVEHRVDAYVRLGDPLGWALTDVWLARRAARDDAWDGVWAGAAAHPASANPAVAAWVAHLRATGRLRRAAEPARALGDALDVLGALPAEPRCTRARLAARVLGSAHALDESTEAGALVTAALAHRHGRTLSSLSSRARRRLWSRAGVETTPLLSRVSVLGLRPAPAGPVTAGVAAAADAGLASVLHLGAVTAEAWALPVGTLVSVCENPSVLDEAAATLGAACPPLVCVEGEASDAAVALLDALCAGGARLRYHGDFGAGGIRIANRIIGGIGAEPWRFRTADHAAALARLAGRLDELPRLGGRVPAAVWDADLRDALDASGVEIEEEHVLDDLLDDLAAGRPRRAGPANARLFGTSVAANSFDCARR